MPVVGCLHRGEERCERMALEVAVGRGVLRILSEQLVVVGDVAVLGDELPVDGEMESGLEEGRTCGVEVDAIDADGTLA